MIGRADIEGSNGDVAMNAWPPRASYPFGNFSDTSRENTLSQKGSLGQAFAASSVTERLGQRDFYPCTPRVVSDRAESRLGHLCYDFEDVPPQPNCPRGGVGGPDHGITAA